MRSVDHLVRNFLAAMRRQAMHEKRVRLRMFHQVGIDLIGQEHVVAARAMLLSHRNPAVGDDTVRVLNSRFGRLCEGDDAAITLGPVDKLWVRFAPLRNGNIEIEAEPRGRLQQRMQHIVAVTGPGKCPTSDRAAMP